MKPHPTYFAIAVCAALPGIAVGVGAITPPKIIQTVEARFPASLERSIIPRGEATVLISIDAEGRLADTLVLEYTHEAFAREAVNALRAWSYEPARKDGQPISARVAVKIGFSTTARVVDLMPVDTLAALVRQPGFYEGRKLVANPAELDTPLTVLNKTTPQLAGPAEGGPNGRTIVEFFVDTDGKARLPVILQSTDPAFAEASVRALDEWRFSIPRRRGEPVIVRTRQEFVFSSDT